MSQTLFQICDLKLLTDLFRKIALLEPISVAILRKIYVLCFFRSSLSLLYESDSDAKKFC